MANRGEGKTQKSISAPKVRGFFEKKRETLTPKSRAGPHSKETSVPLSFFMRNVIGATANMKETKNALSGGNVKVNGKVRKDKGLSIGLFDVVEIPIMKKKYRAMLDRKGRLVAKEIGAKDGAFKVSKVVGKSVRKGGKVWITTNDGFTIEAPKAWTKVSVEDSVRIALPEIKIEEVYPMDKGGSAFIIGGIHTGKTVRIDGIIAGDMKKHKVAELSDGESKFQTITGNVLVVGRGKPEIEAIAGK
ncbi:MAG: hypothetical protein HY544_01335 [Candidatus Diapherotrites archaeon]|uniref:Small ribosomal subunit protein eS4 n=1 Tax=Candidatus Iainarchaeum sp. TaxID=3101447 RepID=A0A8T3YJA9_9ARCH|nr:hypothetical protein [Candidatus Diapherotrites archaeon]